MLFCRAYLLTRANAFQAYIGASLTPRDVFCVKYVPSGTSKLIRIITLVVVFSCLVVVVVVVIVICCRQRRRRRRTAVKTRDRIAKDNKDDNALLVILVYKENSSSHYRHHRYYHHHYHREPFSILKSIFLPLKSTFLSRCFQTLLFFYCPYLACSFLPSIFIYLIHISNPL